jgi:hypothetical protein
MALPHTHNVIAGGKTAAGTGGVGGNEYPTSGENIYDRENPNDTVEAVMFALGTDGDAASADADLVFDFFYDTLFGGFVVRTSDAGSGASGTSNASESEEFDYFTTGGTRTNMLGGSRVHYANDSAVSGQSYPGPIDSIRWVHSVTDVQDIGGTVETFTLSRYHFQGTGSPATIGSYTAGDWFSVHNIGGVSGIDVPTDGVGLRARIRHQVATSGNSTARLHKRHVFECWVRLSGKDDTKVFEAKIDIAARCDSTF